MKLRNVASLVLMVCAQAGVSLAAHPSLEMDYGPFKQGSIETQWDKSNVAIKGIAIKTAENTAVLFDTELLRYAAGWTGGFLNGKGVSFTGGHGELPGPTGTQRFISPQSPGWSHGGNWDDPRNPPDGPLPHAWGRYKGLYLHGEKVILQYQVNGVNVLDMPGYAKWGEVDAFSRTLNVAGNSQTLETIVCETPGKLKRIAGARDEGRAIFLEGVDKTSGHPTAITLEGDTEGASLSLRGTNIVLSLKPSQSLRKIRVTISVGPEAQNAGADRTKDASAVADLSAYTKGGAPRWTEPVTTRGELGSGDGAYIVDTLTVPLKNPYKSWMRIAGLDFFKDGTRAAITTWSGDVWVVSGIDEKLEQLTWKRYATGIFDALGVCIVDDVVYVLGRDQITRLHDLNEDGEADHYECFNNDVHITNNFHEFTFDLQRGPDGSFYFVKGGPVRPGGSGWHRIVKHHGCVLKVSADGKTLEVYATGLRAPNGMGVSPTGQVTTGDNEGTWTPKCKINWVKPGGFLGVVDLAHRETKPEIYDPPVCWLPKHVDNSNGGQTWVTSDKWGPFKGDMLHTSYGTSSLYKVMVEHADGVVQGGVVRFPVDFQSGICRPRFNPKDGQLYVAGLRGWQTNAKQDGAFHRVRYTGKPAHMPTKLHVAADTVQITFTDPLNAESASNVKRWAVKHWNYRWTSGYGSGDWKVSDPKQQGQDTLNVESASVSADGKTVTLKIPGIVPVMQMEIRFRVEAADGSRVSHTIYNTINKVPSSLASGN